MIKVLSILLFSLMVMSCSQGSGETSGLAIETWETSVLTIETEEKGPTEGGKQWVEIAALQSSVLPPDRYNFGVRKKGNARAFHSPGSSSQSYASVLLPPGEYIASVETFSSEGDTKIASKEFTIAGSPPSEVSLQGISWSFNLDDNAQGDILRVDVKHGALPTGLVSAIYSPQSALGPSSGSPQSALGSSSVSSQRAVGSSSVSSQGAVGSSSVSAQGALESSNGSFPLALGSSEGGCESMFTNAGEGLSLTSGIVTLGSVAFPELAIAKEVTAGTIEVTSASLKISGGKDSSSCIQSQIDAINDQLAYQEDQILGLYDEIDRDEQAFFYYLSDINSDVSELITISFNDAIGRVKQDFKIFMQKGGFWNPTASDTLQVWTTEGVQRAIDPIVLASCGKSESACCVNDNPDEVPSFCADVEDDNDGPFDALATSRQPDTFAEDVGHVSNSSYGGGCVYDCYKNITQSDNRDIGLLFKHYAQSLDSAVSICASPNASVRVHCPSGKTDKGNVWDPTVCGSPEDVGTPACVSEPTNAADSFNIVPLFDQYNDAIGAVYVRAVSALQAAHTQEQLINWLNIYRYIASTENGVGIKSITNPAALPGTHYSPASSMWCGKEGYPATPEEHADAFNCAQTQLGLVYAQRLNILYATTLNHMISDLAVDGQVYPSEPLEAPSEWAQWAEGKSWSIDYATEIGKALPAIFWDGSRTPMDLLKRVAGRNSPSPSGVVWTEGSVLYQSYQIKKVDTCMRSLRRFNSDATNSSTDIIDAVGSFEDCPSLFALSDQTPVNQGYYDGAMLQPYSLTVAPGGFDCPASCGVNECASGLNNSISPEGGQGLVDGQCRGFCSDSNTCGDYRYATGNAVDCTRCGSEGAVAQPSLALSAPMPGNIALCAANVIPTVNAFEDETINCPGVDQTLYYGKRYVNALGAGGAKPGFGAKASFVQMMSDATWSFKTGETQSFTCSVDTFPEGSVIEGFDGQCFCGVDGTQLTWYRPQDRPDTGLAALPANLSYLACGNYKAPNSPNVVDEYYSLSSELKNEPPTQYRDKITTDQKTFESDIGVTSAGNGGAGVRYEVAFANIDSQCNDAGPGNILVTMSPLADLPNEEADDGDTPPAYVTQPQCLFTESDRAVRTDLGQPAYMIYASGYWPNRPERLCTWYQDGIAVGACGAGAGGDRTITEEQRCSGVKFKQITNRGNDTYYAYPLQIRPKNLATGELAGGPRIPIDLLMQCSDDGAFECEDQSTCMHMVTFKSAGDANEELAKRGFVCTSKNDDRANPGQRAKRASMECVLQDGRKFQIALSQEVASVGDDEDGRVGVVITELDNNSGN